MKEYQCSYMIADHMEKIGFDQMVTLGRTRRAKYIAQQKRVQQVLLEDGIDDDLPPCVNCPPGVFLFCQTTGAVCEISKHYTEHGKVGTHRCFMKIEHHKADNPHLLCYCTEDENIIKRQHNRKPYSKRGAYVTRGSYNKGATCEISP